MWSSWERDRRVRSLVTAAHEDPMADRTAAGCGHVRNMTSTAAASLANCVAAWVWGHRFVDNTTRQHTCTAHDVATGYVNHTSTCGGLAFSFVATPYACHRSVRSRTPPCVVVVCVVVYGGAWWLCAQFRGGLQDHGCHRVVQMPHEHERCGACVHILAGQFLRRLDVGTRRLHAGVCNQHPHRVRVYASHRLRRRVGATG